jgi:hypothetical protein
MIIHRHVRHLVVAELFQVRKREIAVPTDSQLVTKASECKINSPLPTILKGSR